MKQICFIILLVAIPMLSTCVPGTEITALDLCFYLSIHELMLSRAHPSGLCASPGRLCSGQRGQRGCVSQLGVLTEMETMFALACPPCGVGDTRCVVPAPLVLFFPESPPGWLR